MKINIGDRIQLTRDVFRCKAGCLGRFRGLTPSGFADILMDDGMQMGLSDPSDIRIAKYVQHGAISQATTSGEETP